MSKSPFSSERLSSFSDACGVYLMKDVEGTILYIGKAKNIRNRLRQYFSPSTSDDRIQIPHLLEKVVDIETIITSSETEALLLESRLIKRFQPRYNVLLKDDRSDLLIRMSLEDEYPRIEFVRSKEASGLGPKIFGPFDPPKMARELFDVVVRLCQIRQCSNAEFARRKTPCLLYQLDRCTAPCVQKVSSKDYAVQVEMALDFLSGKSHELKKKLFQKMEEASASLQFERAAVLYRRLLVVEAVGASRKTRKPRGLTDTDVIGFFCERDQLALSVMHYSDGALSYAESWTFRLAGRFPIEDCISQILMQYYFQEAESGEVPGKIVLPTDSSFREPFAQVLREMNEKVIVTWPNTPSLRVLSELAIQNARAGLFQNRVKSRFSLPKLLNLKTPLRLGREPHIIDCFDASHLSGFGLVACCVGFVDGVASKERYRTFHIRSAVPGDDLAMLYEAVLRRYDSLSAKEQLPDLILIDGGREHLKRAVQALKKISGSGNVDIAAIAKDESRHDKGLASETLYTTNHVGPIILQKTSAELLFLQQIRDEAHRFVIRFQRKTRSKNAFCSLLDSIRGIGPKKKLALLTAFSGVRQIAQASAEEIVMRAHISHKDAVAVLEALRSAVP